MGSSPSADLYYGYDLGDMSDPDTYESLAPAWMDEDEDWEEHLARKLGWVEVPLPAGAFEHQVDYQLSWQERTRRQDALMKTPEYQAWSANRDEMRQLLAGYAIEIDRYGYLEDGGCYSVRIEASVQRVGDWGSVALKPIEYQDGWNEQLQTFAELMELPIPPDGPGWHMNCTYG